MFSVLYQRGGEDHSVDFPEPAQFRLAKTVVVGENLVGMRGNGFADTYNPFDLYGVAERARHKALPPHLVFAELEQEPDDACAFLNAYGPLERLQDHEFLREDELRQWKKASSASPSPEGHFRSMLGEVPLLPDPAEPEKDDFYTYPLKQFWEAQSKFELALRLYSALSSSPADQYSSIRRTLQTLDLNWKIGGRNIERQYVERAREFVISTLNLQLEFMQPRIVWDPQAANGATLMGVWGCYSLLEAMYLMLFLDIASRGTRIVQCEKCGALFYTDLERGRYCSATCENRARALRAYHKKKGGS